MTKVLDRPPPRNLSINLGGGSEDMRRHRALRTLARDQSLIVESGSVDFVGAETI